MLLLSTSCANGLRTASKLRDHVLSVARQHFDARGRTLSRADAKRPMTFVEEACAGFYEFINSMRECLVSLVHDTVVNKVLACEPHVEVLHKAFAAMRADISRGRKHLRLGGHAGKDGTDGGDYRDIEEYGAVLLQHGGVEWGIAGVPKAELCDGPRDVSQGAA